LRADSLASALKDIEECVSSGVVDELEARALGWNIAPSISKEMLRISRSLISFRVKKERLGRFLVVTGLDKTGKETQVFNPQRKAGVVSIVEHLKSKGYQVLGIHQPSYNTMMGQLVGAYLGHPTELVKIDGVLDPAIAWLLWSLDRGQQSERIVTWISMGRMHVAVAKRWTESNVVYQSVNGVSPERVLSFESNVVKQDATILLYASIETIMSRLVSHYADAYENVQTLKKVAELYSDLEKLYPYGKVYRISADPDLQTVNRNVLSVVDDLLSVDREISGGADSK
jgi:thymidylate kinase